MQRNLGSLLLANTLLFGTFFNSLPAFSQTTTTTTESVTQTIETTSKPRPKIGLALGGGGTRGAAHVTVLKVLQENGIPIDYIVGTSMGSIVGGMYAAGVPCSDMQEKFEDCSLMKAFMTVPLGVRVLVAPIMVIPRLWSHPYDGLYKGNKFRKYMTKSIPSSEKNIEDLKIPFAAVCLSLIDGKAHRLSKGNLGYAMQASSAVPALRKPVEIDGNLFVDGGVVANVPVKLCREMGADIVIAVNVDEHILPVPLKHFRKIGSVSKRTVNLQLLHVDDPQLSDADVVIHPDVDGIGLISTKKCDARKALKSGEVAAREALPAIRRKLSEAGISMIGSPTVTQ